jgi:hypothetical protein
MMIAVMGMTKTTTKDSEDGRAGRCLAKTGTRRETRLLQVIYQNPYRQVPALSFKVAA